MMVTDSGNKKYIKQIFVRSALDLGSIEREPVLKNMDSKPSNIFFGTNFR